MKFLGPLLGVHCSISGGLTRAIEIGESLGCEAIQIFTKNQVQWREPNLTEQQIIEFRTALKNSSIKMVVSHTSYLINIASADYEKRKKSINSLIMEIKRCESLGIKEVILHPGSATGTSRKRGIINAADSLKSVIGETSDKVRVLLETTAGQGMNIGSTTQELAEIISMVNQPRRLGVCIDIAHIFEAGYDVDTYSGYKAYISELEHYIGLNMVFAIHSNNSKTPKNSHKDRHWHIKDGLIPRRTFVYFMRQKEFWGLPMILETPKEEGMDITNLMELRLIRKTAISNKLSKD